MNPLKLFKVTFFLFRGIGLLLGLSYIYTSFNDYLSVFSMGRPNELPNLYLISRYKVAFYGFISFFHSH